MNDAKKDYVVMEKSRYVCKFGIDELDEIFDGGIPSGSLISIRGPPGAGKTVLAAKFIYEGAKRFNEKGVYLNFIEDKDSFYDSMIRLGMDFKQLEKQGMFSYVECPPIPSRDYIKLVLEKALAIIMNMNASRLVIDSLHSLIDIFSIEHLRELLTSLRKMFKKQGITTLVILEDRKGDIEKIKTVEHIADVVIKLNYMVRYGSSLRYMDIYKVRGKFSKTSRLYFKISDDNGIEIFKPISQRIEAKTKDMYYVTKIRSIDKLIGYIPKGSQVLIITELELDSLELLTSILAFLTISYGGPTIIKSYTTSAGHVKAILINYLEKLNLTKENIEKIMSQVIVKTKDTYLFNMYESMLMDLKEDLKIRPVFEGIHNIDALMEICDRHCLILYINTMLNRKRLGITSFYTYVEGRRSNSIVPTSIYDIILKVEKKEVGDKLYYKLYRLKHPTLGMSTHYVLMDKNRLFEGVY